MYKTLYIVLVSFLTISVATGLTAAEYKGPNLSGQTVSIAGPWLTGDEENFDKVNAYFEKATGTAIRVLSFASASGRLSHLST